MTYESIWSELRGVTFEQGWLDADGIKTRYLMAGDRSRPLLILLHGVGGHAEAYVRNLGPHAEHFWTVAIDMMGHGWTDKPQADYQVADYGRHVLAVVRTLGRERALISGESLGGWVATWLAVHHPERVEKLVLNTAGGWTAHPEVMERLKRLSIEAATDPSPERVRSRLEWLMFDKSRVNDDLIETRRAIYAQPGYAEVMKHIMCLQDMEVRRPNMITELQYKSIQCPTLVVWTSHDPSATPAEGAQIAGMIPNSQFVVMNECGHWPQYENAAEFNGMHIRFLLR
ncbi:alpha/beta fold hydrolase [Sphingobium sp. SJ10-10]|uniref:alpha/beta fold hydrolase n=1 Tax=unclassified Sphingobium TaxID=2611147 RepID=UPI0007701AD9|nr:MULTISPECIES: alpha/beta fold hydrolase [unclassified Sphingobium]AMK24673.1 2-hydroxy-6-ketonona-2,4-dienedoic acid hydrolase [Sphingobium sp. TKS]MEC6698202.1 alpha/beta fold hydrolase [Sphingobium sp. SJ10-10]